MQLTEGEPVADPRLSPRMPVGEDMRGVEKLLMSQPANGAALSIRLNHSCSKTLLMQAALGRDRRIRSFGLRIGSDPCVICYADAGSVAHFNGKAERIGIVTDDV